MEGKKEEAEGLNCLQEGRRWGNTVRCFSDSEEGSFGRKTKQLGVGGASKCGP